MTKKYIPLTQQPYCCVAACLQMVMYRRGIPLIGQEEIANALGLIVPEKDAYLFQNVRTGDKPSSGWGTQITDPNHRPNPALKSLGIPLKIEIITADQISSPEKLRQELQNIQNDEDSDALLCFDYGRLWNQPNSGGHVCVFSGIDGDKVTLIDPGINVAKYRTVAVKELYKAIDFHGQHITTSIWKITAAN